MADAGALSIRKWSIAAKCGLTLMFLFREAEKCATGLGAPALEGPMGKTGEESLFADPKPTWYNCMRIV